MREAEAWKEVEVGESKKRQLATQNNNAAKAVVENFPQLLQEKGKTRDAIANRVGLGSGRNYEKAAKVVTVIDEEANQGHIVLAQALRLALNNQSIDAAHTLLKESPEQRQAIAQLLVDGKVKSTKQAQRMIKKDNSAESNEPTQTTGDSSSVAEQQVSVNSSGDDVDDPTQSESEQSGEVSYKPAEEVVEVVDNFNFSSNGHLNPPASGTLIPSSAGRDHSAPTDVSAHKSANSTRAKAESEISEISNVLGNVFSTVQQLDEEQKDEVFESLLYYIGAKTLGGVIIKFLHQYEIAELCHKCFCAMSEETFPKLRLAELKVSALKLLEKEVQRALLEQHNAEQESKN